MWRFALRDDGAFRPDLELSLCLLSTNPWRPLDDGRPDGQECVPMDG